MSLVNVRCINPKCGDEFKVTKEGVNAVGMDDMGLGIEFPASIDIGDDVEVWVNIQVAPNVGELCPRCSYAAARVVFKSFETEIPNLMAGEHLKEQITGDNT